MHGRGGKANGEVLFEKEEGEKRLARHETTG